MQPLLIRLLWFATATVASAATHAVLPGEAIQPKIDAAAPGDVIAVFGGSYLGDVTINKAVRMVEVDGQDVTITGNVTWNNVTNAPPFEGFTVGSPGKSIVITNSTGLVLKNIDARSGAGITIHGATKIGMVGGSCSQITQDGGELSVTSTNVTGMFTATENARKTVAFRVNVTGNLSWNSERGWLGYSTVRASTFAGSANRFVIVGSVVDGNGTYEDVVDFAGGGNTCYLLNSKVVGARYGKHGHPAATYPGRGCVRIQANNSAFIINNYMKAQEYNMYAGLNDNSYGGYSLGGSLGYAVRSDSSAACVVANNVFEGHYWGVQMPYGNKVNDNFFCSLTSSRWSTGGVVMTNSSGGDPLFVTGQAPKLQPSSPCVNAGANDPIFNDLDGSRNDIGPGGGCLFDPEGWTTDRPVVISFDLAPQQLLKGVDTEVRLSNGQAVAQP